ncbi:copa [Ecytonucleospora hepatopenaei]|uniref:Copa n=1 Tax=Ecytonucleospora hepatopenaei TaxID=646526 RepID=A0A1W0E6Y9_9MICR|nr:hypothetical protein EHP00_2617 [Ecytonucleospora hepatopenaei]OQS54929.1 copa [Ecytonucleospora hepatopenaei]
MQNKHLDVIALKESTRVKTLAFHPFLPVVIGGNHCGTLNIHNYLYCDTKYNNVNSQESFYEHSGSIRVVKIHPSGSVFATGGDDKVIRIWDYNKKIVLNRLKGHTDYIRTLDFHPTQPWILSGSDDCTIKVWNFYTGELLSSSVGHHHYVMSALFLDSTHIISGSLDHTICLWNCEKLFETKKKLLTPMLIQYQTIEAHDRGVNTICIAHDKIYTGSDDREVKVWQYKDETIEYLKTFHSHESNVTAIFNSNDDIFTTGEDSKLIIHSNLVGGSSSSDSVINTHNRLWTVAGKDDVLAVGGDTGLILYSYRKNIRIFESGKNKAIFSVNNKVFLWDEKREGDFLFVCKLKTNKINFGFMHKNKLYVNNIVKNTTEIFTFDGEINANEENSFEVIDKKVENSIYVFNTIKNKVFKILNSSIYDTENNLLLPLKEDEIEKCEIKEEDQEKNNCLFYAKFVEDFLFVGIESNLFVVDAENKRKCIINLNSSYISTLIDIIKMGDFIYFITKYKIFIYREMNNFSFEYFSCISEYAEIIDAKLTEYTYEGKIEKMILYTTTKQLKYVINNKNTLDIFEEGILSSLQTTYKIIGCDIERKKVALIDYNGELLQLDINTGELAFRSAVINSKPEEDEKIIEIIQKEQLPGLAPLEYLIKHQKGNIAIPYIKDTAQKIELFLSAENYSAAFSLIKDQFKNSNMTPSVIKMTHNMIKQIIKNNTTECFDMVNDLISFLFSLKNKINLSNKNGGISEYDIFWFYVLSGNKTELIKKKDAFESEDIINLIDVFDKIADLDAFSQKQIKNKITNDVDNNIKINNQEENIETNISEKLENITVRENSILTENENKSSDLDSLSDDLDKNIIKNIVKNDTKINNSNNATNEKECSESISCNIDVDKSIKSENSSFEDKSTDGYKEKTKNEDKSNLKNTFNVSEENSTIEKKHSDTVINNDLSDNNDNISNSDFSDNNLTNLSNNDLSDNNQKQSNNKNSEIKEENMFESSSDFSNNSNSITNVSNNSNAQVCSNNSASAYATINGDSVISVTPIIYSELLKYKEEIDAFVKKFDLLVQEKYGGQLKESISVNSNENNSTNSIYAGDSSNWFFSYGMDLFTEGKLKSVYDYFGSLLLLLGKKYLEQEESDYMETQRKIIGSYRIALLAEHKFMELINKENNSTENIITENTITKNTITKNIITENFIKKWSYIFYFYNTLKNKEHGFYVARMLISQLMKSNEIKMANDVLNDTKDVFIKDECLYDKLIESKTVKKLLKLNDNNINIDNTDNITNNTNTDNNMFIKLMNISCAYSNTNDLVILDSSDKYVECTFCGVKNIVESTKVSDEGVDQVCNCCKIGNIGL